MSIKCTITVVLVCFAVAACVLPTTPKNDTGERYAPMSGGLVRTNTVYWLPRTFPYAGIQIELPVDVYYASDLPNRVNVMMHPVYPPRSVHAEPTCLIEIRLRRMNKEQQDAARETNLGAGMQDEQADSFQRWDYSRHEQVGRYDEDPYSYFRLDVVCPDDTVVMASADFNRQDGNEEYDFENEDVEAITRILKSISCIEPKPIPERHQP